MKNMLISVVCIFCLVISANAFAGGSNSATAGASAGVVSNPTSTSTLDNNSPSNAEIHTESVNTVYDRKFAAPGGAFFPPTNGFFTSPTPDSSFRRIVDIIAAVSSTGEGRSFKINEEGLITLAAKGGVKAHYQSFRGPKQVKRVKWSGKDKWLTITIEMPKDGRKVALVDGEAKNGTTNSVHVLGRMGLLAIKDGVTHLVITLEGAHRKVEAKGWGIGFHTNAAAVSQNGQQSGIAGGGTGYSSNNTGPEDRPWLHAIAVVVDDVVKDEATKKKAKVKEKPFYGYKKGPM